LSLGFSVHEFYKVQILAVIGFRGRAVPQEGEGRQSECTPPPFSNPSKDPMYAGRTCLRKAKLTLVRLRRISILGEITT
jgi:hypothetical protein